ncbi:MAG: glycosyltransferase family 2 protein [Cyclobacterium sp.]|uniref:glycosyltransferase family 2 protein n=1 Tax=unclassified Cyclobacterium TaxID=2615055 RepID=UPI0013D7243F|nr:glycosyltransferase family 2 protein [Cyclobacterium sp. SYSU L10401]
MKSVSVIIPVFNNQETLERAVLSVIEVAVVSEVIIVVDGSEDDSPYVAKELAEKYKKIKIVFHPNNQNKGASASRNLGLSHTSSDWIQFLDADDELIIGKIEEQIKLVTSETAFVVGNSIHVFPDSKKHYRKSDKEVWKGLIRSKLGDTCSNLWNKKFLLMVGGWNENLSSSQEYNLMFRLLAVNPIVVFDERYLTLIYKTENSISTLPGKQKLRSINWLQLRDRIREHLVKNQQFSPLYKYYWSGAVGLFCDQNKIDMPIQVNNSFYNIYRLQISIKIKIYNLINFNS